MKKRLHNFQHILYVLLFILSINTNQVIACTGRDIVFTNLSITSISSSAYQYTYTIQNIGTTDVDISRVSLQNYVSTDNQVGSDGAAGGSVTGASGTLAPGATYTGSYAAYPFPANPQSSYPYLIVVLSIDIDPECDVTNNTLIQLIEIATGVNSSQIADAFVNWDAEAKNFSVKNWSGNSNTLEYKVYSSSGTLISSGSARKEEPVSLPHLTSGVYVLHLSDGEKVYSQKIGY